MKRIFFLLSIFILIPVCLYLALDRENIDINEFRLDSGYEEVRLSDGITSYKDIGDKKSISLEILKPILSINNIEIKTYPTLRWRSVLNPQLLSIFLVIPEKMSSRDLYKYIEYLGPNGYSAC